MLRAVLEEVSPVLDDIRAITVDLEPGQRLRQRRSMQQTALAAHRGLDVHQSRNDAEHLLESFYVAAGDRQQPELDPALRPVRMKSLWRADQAERVQQCAGEHGIGQCVRRRVETRAITIDRRDRAPEGRRGIGKFRRDLLEKAGAGELLEGNGGMPGPKDLVVLLEEPRHRAPCDFVFMLRDGVEDGFVDRELEPCGQHDRAQHADRIFEKP